MVSLRYDDLALDPRTNANDRPQTSDNLSGAIPTPPHFGGEAQRAFGLVSQTLNYTRAEAPIFALQDNSFEKSRNHFLCRELIM